MESINIIESKHIIDNPLEIYKPMKKNYPEYMITGILNLMSNVLVSPTTTETPVSDNKVIDIESPDPDTAIVIVDE